MSKIKRQVDISKDYIRQVLKDGDIAIDATAGNGNDTLFLAQLVGQRGLVYSFDIQQDAINNTKHKLIENNCASSVMLINDSHEKVLEYINDKVKCAMFNLGYLPNGDHNIVTTSNSTIKAIESILQILDDNGIITIIIYYGHNGGEEEKNNVLEYISGLDPKKYIVQKIENINCINTPPILVVVEKK